MRNALILIMLFVATPVMADAYRWVDENGVVHYSDRPREGAERIELNTRTTSIARPAPADPEPAANAAPATTPARAPQQPATEGYQRLDIVRPQQGETLWNIGAVLTVSLRVSPELGEGHRIQITHNGQIRDDLPTNAVDVQLDNVFRGEHTLQASIVDLNGNVLIQSINKRFYVQQAARR